MPDAHEAAVEAMAAALSSPDGHQWRGAHGTIPPDPDAWHYESDGVLSRLSLRRIGWRLRGGGHVFDSAPPPGTEHLHEEVFVVGEEGAT